MEIPKPMLNQHLVFAPKIEFIYVGYNGDVLYALSLKYLVACPLRACDIALL